MQEFKVGDYVEDVSTPRLAGMVGEITQVCPTFCIVNFGGGIKGDWSILKTSLRHANTSKRQLQSKQISIERLGDKTSVTISGHLKKDDVQSILNLIF